MKLSQLLGEDDFMLGVPSKEKRGALEAVAAKLGSRTGRRAGEVLDALLRRERLGSTATGDGLAIPHSVFAGLSSPVAVIATMEDPVSFDEPDEGVVDLLLGVLWPCDRLGGFLLALAQSSRLLRQPAFRKCLLEAASPAEARAGIEELEARTHAGAEMRYSRR